MNPEQLLSMAPMITRHTYTRRDTILYALGVGAGQDMRRNDELCFVYEEALQALPGMATVLAHPGFWAREPAYKIDWKRLLHGEQAVQWHAPLPIEGTVRGETTIDAIFDKGREKGALLQTTRKIIDESDGTHLANVIQMLFLRGDGGHGGPRKDPPRPHASPERGYDDEVRLATRPEQALIYRLSGDYNPLHVDPRVAEEAGLSGPILHGLCTYGIAARALLRLLCSNHPARIKRIDCRFSAPVYPGDTLTLRVWREGAGRASFQAYVEERRILVLTNGYVEYSQG